MKKKKSLSRRQFVARSSLLAGAYMVPKPQFSPTDTKIVRAAIHPAIGVARVGNSPDHFFIGPEVTEPPLTEYGSSHDPEGAIKRQAARFRIYGYNANGEVVKEITSDFQTDIHWSVHMVNKKADWFQFSAALDIDDAKTQDMTVKRRNSELSGGQRKQLVIDPGEKSVAGANQKQELTGGSFMNIPVSLGELRTDNKGRLLVLSGLGKAGTPDESQYPVYDPEKPESFNNASGWYDDIADGPVGAEVRIAGKKIEVESAWVVTAPPNYAPDVISFRTLYDLLIDQYAEKIMAGQDPFPGNDAHPIRKEVDRQLRETSFRKDVLPVLIRLTRLQWVNKGFADKYGNKAELDFESPELLADLAQPSSLYKPLRDSIYETFRTSDNPQFRNAKLAPDLYGDAFGSFFPSEDLNLGVSSLREQHLKRWVEGNYINDLDCNLFACLVPRSIEDVPLNEQPAMLDKAALHFCLADAYHPGCELTWPMRHLSMYSSPFRIKKREKSLLDCGLGGCGDELDSAKVLQVEGPLYGQAPGDLTRWMAVPWQGDTIYCRSGYDPNFHPFLPAYWPARVPNQVLSERDYLIVIDESQDMKKRLKAFQRRRHWTRPIQGGGATPILEMVKRFAEMGIVEKRPGVIGHPVFPSVMFVETIPQVMSSNSNSPKGLSTTQDLSSEAVDELELDPYQKAGWGSEQEYRDSPVIRLQDQKK